MRLEKKRLQLQLTHCFHLWQDSVLTYSGAQMDNFYLKYYLEYLKNFLQIYTYQDLV